jgi:hypothetical protein
MNKQIGMVNYKVIELLDLNYKEEGFLTIDLNWAGSQITN